jgi:hypothetical protein
VNFWLRVQAIVPASTDSISSSPIENLHCQSSDKLLRQRQQWLFFPRTLLPLTLNPASSRSETMKPSSCSGQEFKLVGVG